MERKGLVTDLRKQIRSFIETNFIIDSTTDLKDEDSLLQLQIVDSTGFLELIHFIEDTFAVKVADEEMVPENLETIDNIAQFVSRKRGA
jgi:acyl carrier protein